MEDKIKECPFCGTTGCMIDTGSYYPKTFYRIICPRHCCMQSKFYDTKDEAIKDWNKRSYF